MYAIIKTGGKQYQVEEGKVISVEKLIAEQGDEVKIRIFKYKAKSNYRRRQGHRQPFTKVQIKKIEG